MSDPVVGVFVGGEARRMGGVAKGLLRVPGREVSIVEHLVALARDVGCEPVIVGRDSRVRERVPDVPSLDDTPTGIGPLGGLAALLTHARDRAAIVLGCDMPFVTRALLERLVRAPMRGAVLAPRAGRDDRYEAMFARYDSATVISVLEATIANGTRSFQALFAALPVDTLALTHEERGALRDWDTPEDVPGG